MLGNKTGHFPKEVDIEEWECTFVAKKVDIEEWECTFVAKKVDIRE